MDMKQQTMLTITEARPSQSGKSLGVKCSDGHWYSTKCWELQNMVGQAIYAGTSQSEWQGKAQLWINDYQVPGQAPGDLPQGSPMQQVGSAGLPPLVKQQQQSPPAPVKPSVDRDASIVAQTLCKCVTYSSPQEAFTGYSWLYDKYILWSKGSNREAENEQVMQAQQQSENPQEVFHENPIPCMDHIPF